MVITCVRTVFLFISRNLTVTFVVEIRISSIISKFIAFLIYIDFFWAVFFGCLLIFPLFDIPLFFWFVISGLVISYKVFPFLFRQEFWLLYRRKTTKVNFFSPLLVGRRNPTSTVGHHPSQKKQSLMPLLGCLNKNHPILYISFVLSHWRLALLQITFFFNFASGSGYFERIVFFFSAYLIFASQLICFSIYICYSVY